MRKMEKTIYLGRTKIQKDGSFTIPKKAREYLNVNVGDTVAIEEIEEKIQITKA